MKESNSETRKNRREMIKPRQLEIKGVGEQILRADKQININKRTYIQ